MVHASTIPKRIPEVFASAFGRELSSSATLTVPTGESWKVTLVEENNQLWFQEGWQNLVEYFSIDCYYFLLFIYEGNSKFEVRIFDLTASEISYPYAAPDDPQEEKKFHSADPGAGASYNNHDNSVRILPNKQRLENDADIHVEVIEKDSDDEPSLEEREEQMDDDGSRGRFSCSSLESEEELDQYGGSKHSTETNACKEETSSVAEDRVWYQDEEVMEALASAGISRPKNPFFAFPLKKYSLQCGKFVKIPAEFARKHIRCEAGEVFTIETSDGRQWPVRCVRTRHVCTLGGGWIAFARDNNLKVGDVCAFELIDAKNHVLKVHLPKISNIKAAEEIGSEHSTETNGYREGNYSSEDRIWYQDEEHMKALASAGISRPKNPFFAIALKTYNLHKANFLHIPGDFAREYIMCEAGEYVKVKTSDGRQWPMRCVRTEKLCRLGCGWIDFARDNDLKVGDVCAFELIDAKNHILKVYIAKMSKIKDAEEFF